MVVEIRADGGSIGEALASLDRLASDLRLVAVDIPTHGVNADGRDVVTVLAHLPQAGHWAALAFPFAVAMLTPPAGHHRARERPRPRM
jgi:hypothetical protein